jgi:hypothetical protein
MFFRIQYLPEYCAAEMFPAQFQSIKNMNNTTNARVVYSQLQACARTHAQHNTQDRPAKSSLRFLLQFPAKWKA